MAHYLIQHTTVCKKKNKKNKNSAYFGKWAEMPHCSKCKSLCTSPIPLKLTVARYLIQVAWAVHTRRVPESLEKTPRVKQVRASSISGVGFFFEWFDILLKIIMPTHCITPTSYHVVKEIRLRQCTAIIEVLYKGFDCTSIRRNALFYVEVI